MTEAAPGMDRHSETPLDWPASAFTAQMRFLFVTDQVGGEFQFLRVNFRAIGELHVLEEELELIHLQRGRRVRHCGHGEEAALRMIRSTPGSLPATIGANPFPNQLRVRNLCENVREGRGIVTTVTAGAPDFRIHCGHGSIFFRRDFYI